MTTTRLHGENAAPDRRALLAMLASVAILAGCAPTRRPGAEDSMSGNAGNSGKSAKRAPPPEVPDITFDGVTYAQASGEDQRSGYLEARDAASGAALWRVKVYAVAYDREKETDVQDVYFSEMTLDREARTLTIGNEHGDVFEVGIDSRAVRRVE